MSNVNRDAIIAQWFKCVTNLFTEIYYKHRSFIFTIKTVIYL